MRTQARVLPGFGSQHVRRLGLRWAVAEHGYVHEPRWVQRVGLEWAYRLALEPGRLARRYAGNGWFALRMLARDALGFRG